jgi:hypothetical protein
MSLLEDRCTTSPMTTGDDVDKNQEEALCNQFAAMPSPSRPSQQQKSAGEDGKSLGKCSDDSTSALHDMITDALIVLEKDWNGHLLLRCLPMTSQDIENPDMSGEPVDDINICDYLSGKKKEQHYVRLNFSPSEFPPPLATNPFERGNKVWSKLKKYIEKSSFDSSMSDSPVVCTSAAARGMGKKFACQVNNDSNKKSKSEKRTDVDFRQTFLVNDGERGERPNGRALPRKTSCQDVSKGTCGFSFTVKCDQLGYHITLKRNGGNCVHSHHAKLDSTDVSKPPLRLLNDNDYKELKHVHRTQAGEALCRAYLYEKFGKYYPRGKIAYLLDKDPEESSSKEKEFQTDVDNMLKGLIEDENTASTVFWDMAADGNDGCRLVSHSKNFDKQVTVTDLSSDTNMEKVREVVHEDREARNIRPDQNLFLSVMWIDKGETTNNLCVSCV